MKIFNIENGVKKVYVQMNDMGMLNSTDLSIPASIYLKVFKGLVFIDDSNRMDFIEFIEPKEIKFFESLDWIVDYKKIRSLSEKEITAMGQEIVDEMNRIANKFNSMTDEEKKYNQSLVQEHDLLNYKMKYLIEILGVKQGHREMPFPLVPDSEGFSFVGDNKSDYEIRASLDPNKILLFRKDGKVLEKDEKIPQGFLQSGMLIAIMERTENDEFSGDYEMSNYLTKDNQYLVTEFKIKKYDDLEEQKKEKGIIQKIKKRKNN